MKICFVCPALLLALTLATQNVNAADSGKSVSIGIKSGTHKSSLDEIDDGSGVGLVLAYESGKSLAVELEYLTASLDTKVFGQSFSTDIQTLASYTTYRSRSPLYGLFKIGLILEYVDNGIIADSDLGLSLGLGGGYRLNDAFSFEVEYTRLESDVDFIGGTLRFSF